jgi:hypothetical protein
MFLAGFQGIDPLSHPQAHTTRNFASENWMTPDFGRILMFENMIAQESFCLLAVEQKAVIQASCAVKVSA